MLRELPQFQRHFRIWPGNLRCCGQKHILWCPEWMILKNNIWQLKKKTSEIPRCCTCYGSWNTMMLTVTRRELLWMRGSLTNHSSWVIIRSNRVIDTLPFKPRNPALICPMRDIQSINMLATLSGICSAFIQSKWQLIRKYISLITS